MDNVNLSSEAKPLLKIHGTCATFFKWKPILICFVAKENQTSL